MLSKFSASTLYQVTSGMGVELERHVAHQVLHKNRVFVGPFRHRLFVLPFEQGIQLRAGRAFHQRDQILNPNGACRERTCTVTNPRWLCAPCRLMALEHGHSVVTPTRTVSTKSISRPIAVASKRAV